MCRRCRRNNPEPGVRGWGMHLKKKSGSGRARSQTILNSTVREEGRCAGGVGAAPPNPGPGVEGFTMVAAARRRAMPRDAAGHIARARHWAMRPGISRARGTGPGPVAAVAPASAPPAPSCSVSRRTAAPPLRRRRGLWGSRRRRLVALGGKQDSTVEGGHEQPPAPRFIGQHGNARGLQPRQPAQCPAALRLHLHMLAKGRMPIRPCTRRHGVVGRDLVAALRRADVQ